LTRERVLCIVRLNQTSEHEKHFFRLWWIKV
jgi:hypothetical protein